MVKRWELVRKEFDDGEGLYEENIIGECCVGDFVRHEDYEEVADRLADCQVEIKWLQDRLASCDLFR